jgi:ELP3 family radical SAM enzyme/protein acetyltransferase
MCSHTHISNIKDFEDICRANISDENIKIYKEVLKKLDNWTNNYVTSKGDISNIRKEFIKIYSSIFRSRRIEMKKIDLIITYKDMINNNEIIKNDTLSMLLQKKPSRNISGITSITLVMSPHPDGQTFSCKHNCYYCPNEPAHEGNNWQAQPRSYLYNEPAVHRANENGFKAYEQMISRMNVLYANGHVIDKLEIILEGGTYTEYPPDYLERYHRDIFYAANTFFDCSPKREPYNILKEIGINKDAKVHIIGFCIETRPDAIDNIWIERFRYWGVTRIQLGVQHVDNKILKKINRGHTIETAIEAIKMLKENCFKIDIHIMPDLPNSTPEIDKKMFDYVYNIIHPDQVKVYPCEVTPWTVIEKWYKKCSFVPYSEKNMNDLIEVIKYSMSTCPSHIRLPRVVRDIPISYIEAGNPYSNLRQMIDNSFEKDNINSMEIRSREIGRHVKYYNEKAYINVKCIDKSDGIEYFIAYESWDKKALFGFLRLRLPNCKNHKPVFNCIKNHALIRELHVYGLVNAVGDKNNGAAQHKGIGKQLIKKAEQISKSYFYEGIVVISGEGVKNYYENLGYKEIDTYMIKSFYKTYIFEFMKIYIIMVLMVILIMSLKIIIEL